MTDTNAALYIERVFGAPPALVYRAFTDPDQLAQWFAPVGFSTPRDTLDVDAQVGGHHRYVMRNDQDPEWASPVAITFTEVIEDEVLDGTYIWDGVPGIQDGGEGRLRVEFHAHDHGKQTRLVVRQGPYVEQMEDLARRGWESSFTKLEPLLAA